MTTDINISTSLQTSKNLSDQIAARLDGLNISELPDNKRLQLAMACQHLAIEHGQAIIHLVDNEFYGSALALQRPMLEAIVRGVWIRHSAANEEVEIAISGTFPRVEEMVKKSPRWGDHNSTPPLKEIKEIWWRRFCDYTHGGLEQIHARLDKTGLRANYDTTYVMTALRWSDLGQLFSGVQIAYAAKNETVAQELLNLMIDYERLSHNHYNCSDMI